MVAWGNCVSSGTCPSGQWTLEAVALGLWHHIKQANWHLNTLELWSSTYLCIKGPPPDSNKLRTATLLEFPLPHVLHRHKTRQASHIVSMSLSVGFLSTVSSQRELLLWGGGGTSRRRILPPRTVQSKSEALQPFNGQILGSSIWTNGLPRVKVEQCTNKCHQDSRKWHLKLSDCLNYS